MLALLLASALSVVDAEARRLHFHGVVRVERQGRILVHKGYGLRSDTAFWVASISKSFTAALILRLQELGALRLDDPVSKYVAGGPDIRIDELLTHTSGLPRATYAAEGITDRDEAARAIFALAPGARGSFAYSNDGYVLLAIVAERAGRAPFYELLQREVLAPAGLAHTGFWPSCVRGVRVAKLKRPPEGDLAVENWGFKGPEGVCSTAWDLGRFIARLAYGMVLSPRSRELLWEKAVALPDGGFAARGFFVDGDTIWTRGTEEWGHNGVVKWLPKEQTVIVVLSDVPEPRANKPAPSRALGDALERKLDKLR